MGPLLRPWIGWKLTRSILSRRFPLVLVLYPWAATTINFWTEESLNWCPPTPSRCWACFWGLTAIKWTLENTSCPDPALCGQWGRWWEQGCLHWSPASPPAQACPCDLSGRSGGTLDSLKKSFSIFDVGLLFYIFDSTIPQPNVLINIYFWHTLWELSGHISHSSVGIQMFWWWTCPGEDFLYFFYGSHILWSTSELIWSQYPF